jgi:hypothetical protein
MAHRFGVSVAATVVLMVAALLLVDTFVVDVPGWSLFAAFCALAVLFLVSESRAPRSHSN